MTQADRVHSTPPTNTSSNIAAPTMGGCPDAKLDIEDALDGAFHMSSVAATLAETIFSGKASDSIGDLPNTYLISQWEIDRLLFTLYEAHAQIRESRDQYLLWEDPMAATHAGAAKPDTQRSGMSNAPEIDWKRAYLDMESFLYDITHMAQITDDICESARDDEASWNRFAFAVNRSRTMLEDFQRRYHKRDWKDSTTGPGLTAG